MPERDEAGRTYSTSEVAALLELPLDEVRGFARAGLVDAARGPRNEYRFDFRDLVVLRMAARLRHASVPARRIERALADVRRARGAVAAVRLEPLGGRVVVREGERAWSPGSGQLQLDLEAPGRTGGGEAASERVEPEAARPGGIPRVDARPEADDWAERASRLEAGDPAGAMDAYGRALALEPGHAEAHAGLAFLLHDAGRLEEAVLHYREALAASPDGTAAYNLGVALDDLGREAEAVEAYRRALELDPGLADAHFNLSALFERAGDRAAALRHMIAYRELASRR